MANSIDWVEFSSQDLGGTEGFFGKLFGWTFQPMGDDYRVFHTGVESGLQAGGFGTHPFHQAAVAYISVDDIEAKLAEIEAAGGSMLVPKTQVAPDIGYIAQFKDPHGVVWGLWSKH